MKKVKCISPIDGSTYAERTCLNLTQAKEYVKRAKLVQKNWEQTPLQTRVDLVKAGVAKIGELNDLIIPELAWQMGRPIRYGGEFSGFSERANYMASIASEALSNIVVEDSKDFKRVIKRVPHGVVLVIAPWNYPFMTAINTIAPALISGNSVVLKHASQTPIVGERIAEAFHSVGIPDHVFQNLTLDHETTTRLISSGFFNFVNFTGSVTGGKAMEAAASGTFTSLGLELGGKDPGYVMEDANLDKAVETLIDGAMFNSGQCCCGIERIYVNQNLYNKFIEKAVKVVESYKLGNPLNQETTLGPMANIKLANKVREQTRDAIALGARPLIDPLLFPEDDGAYLMPQILVDVDHSMTVMRDESFGPVIGIMAVENDQEAIDLMNDSPFGLTASLWTQDAVRAEAIADQIETGTVFMNRADYLDPSLCWTGCKDTGRGGSLSIIGYHNLTRPKSYHLKIDT
jgi:acyl-CoA reductase-like NAD-dependent aldehyde dehydrogenase